jgi:hypothetical protein
MLSIWEYTDGYYAVGLEGQNKFFVPSYEAVLDLINNTFKAAYRNSSQKIRKTNCTLEEHFKGSNV